MQEIRAAALRTPTLPPATHTACYLVGPCEGPGEVYVVDPASPYPDQQDALDQSLGDARVEAVALTHHHGDHVGGAEHLAARLGVPIVAHRETAARLPFVTQTIDDGESIGHARALFTPGHAPGHLCFAVGDALIAGDMVAGVGTILIDPAEGDMSVYLASLERMMGRARVLLPAHGPVITDADAKLREYVAHRMMREGRVVAALEAGRAKPDALVALAYADTPRPLWPVAERSLLAHLAKLARDGRAKLDDDGVWELV